MFNPELAELTFLGVHFFVSLGFVAASWLYTPRILAMKVS